MVKAKWVNNKLVVEPITAEEQAALPPFVQDTLDIGSVAVADGVAYALDEQHARDQLE